MKTKKISLRMFLLIGFLLLLKNSFSQDLNVTPDAIPLITDKILYQNQAGTCWEHRDFIATLPNYIPNSHAISTEGYLV